MFKSKAGEVPRVRLLAGRQFLNGEECDVILDQSDGRPGILNVCEDHSKTAIAEGVACAMSRVAPRADESMQWTLWRVWNFGARTGYLVTTGEATPRPVAFVPGTDASALRAANRIRRDHSFAARSSEAIDLREFNSLNAREQARATWHFMYQMIIERVLVPVDNRGLPITNHGRFCAGMYGPIVVEGRWILSFALHTHGLEELTSWPMIVGGAVQKTRAQQRAAKKSPSNVPHAAQPASKSSNGKGVATGR